MHAMVLMSPPHRLQTATSILKTRFSAPHQPIRQWALSVPFPLRFLFASEPAVMGKVLGIVYRTIATYLTHKAEDSMY